MEFFYNDIKKAIKLVKSSEINIVMGDFNARVSKDRRDSVVGAYGLGVSNDRGNRLINFCQEKDLIIAKSNNNNILDDCIPGHLMQTKV